MDNYSRPLYSEELVDLFLKNVLEYPGSKYDLSKKICRGEELLPKIGDQKNTLFFKDKRADTYRDNSNRWRLRKKIIQELFVKQRLDDDNKIKLGRGGALPTTSAHKESKAYIITGLPASGKSGIANKIADFTHSIILDSDYAKRKFPEFDNPEGASLVHEESSFLISGNSRVSDAPSDFEPLSVKCAKEKYNVCIPKIGNTVANIEGTAKPWKEKGYEIHLILVQLDRKLATIRAINRFKQTGRYVPIGLIFDGYGNDPLIAYYRIKKSNENSRIFESIGKLSTDVDLGSSPEIIDSSPVLVDCF